jgi:quercetin dioxygenase-like cupin family protein
MAPPHPAVATLPRQSGIVPRDLASEQGEAVETWDIASLDVKSHHPKVLRSDREARVIAINLPAGEELQEHQVHERAWLVVASGEIEFAAQGTRETGGPGFLVHFEANERHEVRATADSKLLLILAPWPGEGHPSNR